MRVLLLLFLSIHLIGCQTIIENHELDFEANQVISRTTISDKFGLPFTGNFPLIIKEKEYGEVNLFPKTESDPFIVETIADFSTFQGDVWDGFGPINRLPGNTTFPSWVKAKELLKIDIPTNNDSFGVELIVGKEERFYFGIHVTIKAINDAYPQGLKASQEISRRDGKDYPWAEIFIHGPTPNDESEEIEDAGIVILSSFGKNEINL